MKWIKDKHKILYYKTFRRKRREKLLDLGLGYDFFFFNMMSKADAIKAKINK